MNFAVSVSVCVCVCVSAIIIHTCNNKNDWLMIKNLSLSIRLVDDEDWQMIFWFDFQWKKGLQMNEMYGIWGV